MGGPGELLDDTVYVQSSFETSASIVPVTGMSCRSIGPCTCIISSVAANGDRLPACR